MKLALKIAWRYIFSRKSTNVINLISGVSMLGIIVGSAALIIVLSAFNGFEDLVKQLYSSFYPDLHLSPVEGKTFPAAEVDLAEIWAIPGVEAAGYSLEENAIIVYKGEEHIAVLKGVDTEFEKVAAVDDSVLIGRYRLEVTAMDGSLQPSAILGAGVADVLGVALGPSSPPLTVYMPKRGLGGSIGGTGDFRKRRIYPTGIFRIQQEFDSEFVIVPLDFMQNLLGYRKGEVGAIEIKLANGADKRRVHREIKAIAGDAFILKNRYQLNETVYRVMKSEKWAVYLVLTFILIVAAFNMIGSISLLVIEKKKDIGILRAMGASSGLIQRIFLTEGMMQTILSMVIGFGIAIVLCLGQQAFEWIKIPGAGTFVVQAYPVSLQFQDFLLVFATILLIGLLASWFPAHRAAATRYIFKD